MLVGKCQLIVARSSNFAAVAHDLMLTLVSVAHSALPNQGFFHMVLPCLQARWSEESLCTPHSRL